VSIIGLICFVEIKIIPYVHYHDDMFSPFLGVVGWLRAF
jgi:hypothetical protein